MRTLIAGAVALLAMGTLQAQNRGFDAALAFGTRISTAGMTLSPDGQNVAYIGPVKGAATAVVTRGVADNAPDHIAASADGNPQRLSSCTWVSNVRLLCDVTGVVKDAQKHIVPFIRKLSFDAGGGGMQDLGQFGMGFGVGGQVGGEILETIPAENAVLMAHMAVPRSSVQLAGSSPVGLGVNYVDTRTGAVKPVELPNNTTVSYMTDGQGAVRIKAEDPMRAMGPFAPPGGGGTTTYMYRNTTSRIWHTLSTFKTADFSGFRPLAIDAAANVAYGIRRKDGHGAVCTVKLDDSLTETELYADPAVEVTGLVQIGRQPWVVGATYVGKTSGVHYLDPQIAAIMTALAKAVPDEKLALVGASDDHNKLLILANNEGDPGIYYIFDRARKNLATFLPVRRALEGVKLATAKPVSYTAKDGTTLTATLLMPPGKESAKGLPAVVLSDVGTAARDPSGFDWLAQFLAIRGYVVLLPAYRGDAMSFSDPWSNPAYSSWSVAVGDVTAGAHWLVTSGIADAKKLAVAGWSYGGYAALESAVVEPDLFKAVIAIAPLTDLDVIKDSHRMFPDFNTVSKFVGNGSSAKEGSPVEQAAAIKASVLLFHGAMDLAAPITHSQKMDEKLKAASKTHELVTWESLDHQLEDSDARTMLLRKSDELLRKALAL